jgi:hypothetical protein
MPSVFTLSGSGRRKKRRKGSRGLAGAFRRCPTTPVSLRRERLNSGGYDENGRYFGRGEPLFAFDSGDDWGHLRAASRKAAVAKLRAECPGIRFKRG